MKHEYKAKEVRLIGTTKRTSNRYGRNLAYRSYRVIVDNMPIETLFTRTELKELPYWSTRSNTMAMTCWGTSQLFEAQLALARFLGHDQKKGEEWSAFTRRATALVVEI